MRAKRLIILKKLALLLVVAFICHTTNAQIKKNGWYYIPLPMNDSAEWCVVSQDGRHQQPEWRSFRYYKTLGDSSINGYNYKKVWTNTQHHKYYISDTLVCMYRQDTFARKVYVRSALNYYSDTNEYLLMDFGVKDDDTLELPIFTRNAVYEKRKFIVVGLDSQITVITSFPKDITYYDRILYGAQCLDTVGLTYGEKYWYPLSVYSFVEGVGNDASIGPFAYPIARKEYFTKPFGASGVDTVSFLHCLEFGGWTRWIEKGVSGINFCDKEIGIIPIDRNALNFLVFPNPCSEYVDIYSENFKSSYLIQIFDMEGKMVDQVNHSSMSGTIRVSTQNIDSGIYLLIIRDTHSGLNFSSKLIKH